ncbi:hypothetical protein ACJMK2_035958 [Sinanodonta woodiana]|uniref:Uncharacterized protein n=1 Tax=Sinanodonta woodiana TaxID=1069815 RepID=A0ABD3WFP3_SINWO
MDGCSCIELERFLLLAPCPPFGADDIFWELMNDLADDKTINRSILTYNETRILAKHCNISERITKETVSPETTSAVSLSIETTSAASLSIETTSAASSSIETISAASSSAGASVQSSIYIYVTIGIVCTLTLIALIIGIVKLKRHFNKRKESEEGTTVSEYSNISSNQSGDIKEPQSDGPGKQQNKNHSISCTPDTGPPDSHVTNQTGNEIPLVTLVCTLTSRDDKSSFK